VSEGRVGCRRPNFRRGSRWRGRREPIVKSKSTDGDEVTQLRCEHNWARPGYRFRTRTTRDATSEWRSTASTSCWLYESKFRVMGPKDAPAACTVSQPERAPPGRRWWPATLQQQVRALRDPPLAHLAHADHTRPWRAPGAEESVSRRQPGDADAGTARRCSGGVLPACRCCGCAEMGAQWRGCTHNVSGHANLRRASTVRAVFRDRGTHRAAPVQRTGAQAHLQGRWDSRNARV
jgi:hypothetical protein